MFYARPLCLHILSSWSFRENCTSVDDYNEKCSLYNPCKLQRGHVVQVKDCDSCSEEIYDSHTRDFDVPIVPMINMIIGKILTLA